MSEPVTAQKSRLNVNPETFDVPEAVVFIVRDIARKESDFSKVRAVVTDTRRYLGNIGAVVELRSPARTLGHVQIIGKRYVDGDIALGYVPSERVPTWEL